MGICQISFTRSIDTKILAYCSSKDSTPVRIKVLELKFHISGSPRGNALSSIEPLM